MTHIDPPAFPFRADTPVRDAVRAIEAALAEAGVDAPLVDAELLVGWATGRSRGGVQAASVTGGALADAAGPLAAAAERRRLRHPLQHITGVASFRSIELAVGPGVFVPRPETELLAGLAIDRLRAAGDGALAADLGTGSGAVALAMATEAPEARVWAVEASEAAHAWAARNVARIAPDRVTLVLGDLAGALDELAGRLDVVASNPPYVPDDAVPRDIEVREHDPAMALYGGADGLDVVRVLSTRAAVLLRPGGILLIEHGEEQGAAIRALLAADGWLGARTEVDLTGRDRVTLATSPA